jgi:hypothetical protein
VTRRCRPKAAPAITDQSNRFEDYKLAKCEADLRTKSALSVLQAIDSGTWPATAHDLRLVAMLVAQAARCRARAEQLVAA